MPDQPTAEQLMEEVRAAREDYIHVERTWAEALRNAHASDEDSPDHLKHLRAANDIGPEVLSAMARYQEAVRKLLNSLGRRRA